MLNNAAATRGAIRVRTNAAMGPSRVTNVNARSVVATSREAEGDTLRLEGVEDGRRSRAAGTAAIFHPRLMASPMPVFIPCPPTGLCTCRVTQEKHAPRPEASCHAVMHAIGGEPFHGVDVEVQVLHRAAPDVGKRERGGVARPVVSYGADQANASLAPQRKDDEEVRIVQVDVQLVIGDGP